MTTNTPAFQVVAVTLTDGSIAYNVQGEADGRVIVIGCEDQAQANRLADALEASAWIEVGDAVEPEDIEPRARSVELYDAEDAADELACMREGHL